MSDTHDNGREEQWTVEGPVFDADGNCDVWGIWAGERDKEGNRTMRAWVYYKADADSIIDQHNNGLAARALAGLAQRIAEQMREDNVRWPLHPYYRGWLARYDALTAGREAAAEVNDGE